MDFDNYISSRLKEGATIEDIAKEFTATLNKKQKELEVSETRTKFRNAAFNALDAAFDTGHWSLNDVVAAAVVYAMEAHSDWGIDTLQAFKREVQEMVHEVESVTELRRRGDPGVQLMDKILEGFKKVPEPIGAPYKGCTGSTKENKTSDEEKINEFLKKMRW